MAFRGETYALAVKVQADANTPATVNNTTDLLTCYDLQPGGNSFTLANPESTGGVDRPGDAILGRDRSVTFNVILRGPGGSAPPALDAFVFGRILRAAGFSEERSATPLLAATALASATLTTITFPAGGSAVDDFYNGLPVQLSDQGTGVKQLSMVRDYVGSTKVATMMETFDSAPAANIAVPAFLAYRYKANAPELFLSVDWWLDKKRYKMVHGTVTSLQFNFNVSNNGDTSFTYASVTISGDVHPSTPEVDEDSPQVTQGGAMPVFRDADWWVAGKSVCGSSAVAEFSIQAERPPCPTRQSGGEPMQRISVTRSVNLALNEVLLSAQDYNALADAQSYHGMWLMYGNQSGKTVSFGVMDGRFGYSEAERGTFVTRTPQMFIDSVEKSMSLVFPYW